MRVEKQQEKVVQMKTGNIFYCYPPKLKCELLNIGERYIAKSKNDNSNRFYWMFLRTEQLNRYLDKRPKTV